MLLRIRDKPQLRKQDQYTRSLPTWSLSSVTYHASDQMSWLSKWMHCENALNAFKYCSQCSAVLNPPLQMLANDQVKSLTSSVSDLLLHTICPWSSFVMCSWLMAEFNLLYTIWHFSAKASATPPMRFSWAIDSLYLGDSIDTFANAQADWNPRDINIHAHHAHAEYSTCDLTL